MPGLAIKINLDKKINFERCLDKISKVYKIPTISYNEKYLSSNNTFFYSLLPNFIQEKRLGQFLNNRYIIAIDGDYYNQTELNKSLNLKNTTSKLETLLHLYLNKGEDFAKLINGEFVIVIYDLEKNNLIVTNDRFARRTFFWYKDDQNLLFASEKKGIVAINNRKLAIDYQGLLEVFTFKHNLNSRTFIKNISALEPSTILQIDENKITKTTYFTWKFNTNNKLFDKNKTIKDIYDKLKKAIKRRINNKEKILLWLSGGYDSRAIACSLEKNHKTKVKTKTFGEKNSEELDIAKNISKTLELNWSAEQVKSSYLETAKFGAWKTEFAFSAMEHPFIGNHLNLKPKADYILSGLPGLDVLNGSFINIGKITQSLFKNFYKKWYISYSVSKEELSLIFKKNFLDKYSSDMEKNFNKALDKIKCKKKLDKWDIFIITQRQPNYSNISDLCENDLFETLHPFCDTDLLETFLNVPLRKRMFMQLSKSFLYKYFPDVRNIEYDGRGKLRNNNSLFSSMFLQLKSKFSSKKVKSIIWDKERALTTSYDATVGTIKTLLEQNSELNIIFNYASIYKILSNEKDTLNHSYLVDTLITFLFSYQYLLKSTQVQPPIELIENYIS